MTIISRIASFKCQKAVCGAWEGSQDSAGQSTAVQSDQTNLAIILQQRPDVNHDPPTVAQHRRKPEWDVGSRAKASCLSRFQARRKLRDSVTSDHLVPPHVIYTLAATMLM